MLNLAGDDVWMWMIQVWNCYSFYIARGVMETGWACLPCRYSLSHGVIEHTPFFGLRYSGLLGYHPTIQQQWVLGEVDFISVDLFEIFRKFSLIPIATDDELYSQLQAELHTWHASVLYILVVVGCAHGRELVLTQELARAAFPFWLGR